MKGRRKRRKFRKIQKAKKKSVERERREDRKKTEIESKKKTRGRKIHGRGGRAIGTGAGPGAPARGRGRGRCAHPLSRTWSGSGCWHHGSVSVAVPERGPAGPRGWWGSPPAAARSLSGAPLPRSPPCAASRAPAAAPNRSSPAAGTPQQRQRAALPRPGPAAGAERRCEPPRPVPSCPAERGRCAAPRSGFVPRRRRGRGRDRAPEAAPGAAPARAAATGVRGSARQPCGAQPVGMLGSRGWGRRE